MSDEPANENASTEHASEHAHENGAEHASPTAAEHAHEGSAVADAAAPEAPVAATLDAEGFDLESLEHKLGLKAGQSVTVTFGVDGGMLVELPGHALVFTACEVQVGIKLVRGLAQAIKNRLGLA